MVARRYALIDGRAPTFCGDPAEPARSSQRSPAGRAPALAFVVAFMAGTVATGDDPEHLCPGVPLVERSSQSFRVGLWPPGAIDCEYTAPDGTVTNVTYVPWREWGSAALFALGMWFGFRALITTTQQLLMASYGLLAVVGAIAVWAIGFIAVLLVAVAAAPPLVLLLVRRAQLSDS
jgi:hypothetical protein